MRKDFGLGSCPPNPFLSSNLPVFLLRSPRTRRSVDFLQTVLLEPAEHALPAVLSRWFVIARSIVGVEGVAGVGIDVETGGFGVGVLRGGEGGFHFIDLFDRDALVFFRRIGRVRRP